MPNINMENVKGRRKAAALLVLLGEEASSQLMKYFWEDEVEKISREMSVLNNVPPDLGESVLEEFHNMALARQYMSTGGIEFTKKVLQKALGSDGARRVIDRVTKSIESSVGFNALEKADPHQLSKFIQNEHPQTIALILAHLDPGQGAELLGSLPEEVRPDIVVRMANLGEISPEVIKRISLILDQKLAARSWLGAPTAPGPSSG